jgi:hypothetical protein
MNDKLTDIQRRALLWGEVQKLRASGMDYDSAFQTAVEAHPEWRTVEPLAGQNRQRRTGAQMVNDGGAITDEERSRRIQELVSAYLTANPKVSYDAAFQRVLTDPKNAEPVKGMHQPQRAFKPIQTNHGAGGNTPSRSPAPKSADLKYGPGAPPDRFKLVTS